MFEYTLNPLKDNSTLFIPLKAVLKKYIFFPSLNSNSSIILFPNKITFEFDAFAHKKELKMCRNVANIDSRIITLI